MLELLCTCKWKKNTEVNFLLVKSFLDQVEIGIRFLCVVNIREQARLLRVLAKPLKA